MRSIKKNHYDYETTKKCLIACNALMINIIQLTPERRSFQKQSSYNLFEINRINNYARTINNDKKGEIYAKKT
jgi:hypothetical protein